MGGAGVEGERERKTFTGSLKRNHIQRGEAIKVCVWGGDSLALVFTKSKTPSSLLI